MLCVVCGFEEEPSYICRKHPVDTADAWCSLLAHHFLRHTRKHQPSTHSLRTASHSEGLHWSMWCNYNQIKAMLKLLQLPCKPVNWIISAGFEERKTHLTDLEINDLNLNGWKTKKKKTGTQSPSVLFLLKKHVFHLLHIEQIMFFNSGYRQIELMQTIIM